MYIGREGWLTSKRRQVAELAGVSEATVSRVLSGVGPIREETKRRVLEAAERVGYTPSAIARSFVTQRSGNIGVVLPVVPKVHLFSAYYFSEILSGVGHAVERRGYNLLLQFRPADKPPDYESAFRMRKVDGCLILGATSSEAEAAALCELHENEWPFVVVGQRFDAPYAQVDADHISGGRQATEHLLAAGLKRIALVNGPESYSNSVDRRQGFESALRAAGVEPDASLLFAGNYSRKSGYELAEALFARRTEFDAVFAANDRMAIGLMQGLKEYGLRAGIDYALIGYDDSEASRATDPPLTTVHVPFFEMGLRAAERLLDAIHGANGETAPELERLDTTLVVRASTRLP
ncbi:LacI family DNA-binding transcriptional regulator [Paenibacillus sp.]|uniref:LacI family DNA-binding transcriptional regulator n=1 Tax=Paenibacillus sp. TaxID=58172 RepID=UPI002D34412F|nr:LacI family DNA-binding transcriptional regulator [Paenibacillus sp.]HZG56288.1 LacI family DNA-binding transcriptional regulator [Paenibacillus sp.]